MAGVWSGAPHPFQVGAHFLLQFAEEQNHWDHKTNEITKNRDVFYRIFYKSLYLDVYISLKRVLDAFRTMFFCFKHFYKRVSTKFIHF